MVELKLTYSIEKKKWLASIASLIRLVKMAEQD